MNKCTINYTDFNFEFIVKGCIEGRMSRNISIRNGGRRITENSRNIVEGESSPQPNRASIPSKLPNNNLPVYDVSPARQSNLNKALCPIDVVNASPIKLINMTTPKSPSPLIVQVDKPKASMTAKKKNVYASPRLHFVKYCKISENEIGAKPWKSDEKQKQAVEDSPKATTTVMSSRVSALIYPVIGEVQTILKKEAPYDILAESDKPKTKINIQTGIPVPLASSVNRIVDPPSNKISDTNHGEQQKTNSSEQKSGILNTALSPTNQLIKTTMVSQQNSLYQSHLHLKVQPTVSKSSNIQTVIKANTILQTALPRIPNVVEHTNEGKVFQHQPQYVKIRKNRLVPPAKSDKQFEVVECWCKPDDKSACGPNSQCMNVKLKIECNADCSAKDKCQNQRFAKCINSKFKLKYFGSKGWGLIALENIPSKTFIIEYIGELIDSNEFKRRFNQCVADERENYYFLSLDNCLYIDSGRRGNEARFINHSCHPNCDLQKWSVNGETRIGVFAAADIMKVKILFFSFSDQTHVLYILSNFFHSTELRIDFQLQLECTNELAEMFV